MQELNENQTPSGSENSVFVTNFNGKGVDLAVIIVKNILLTIVTLGVYSFWGKVNVRKYLWQNSEFHLSRFVYTGTGGELFKGFLKVMGVVVGISAVSNAAMLISAQLGFIVMALIGVAYAVLVPFAIYASQRYLYSRTTWRGMRFGMHENAGPFIKTFVSGVLLSIITLGIYIPIASNRLFAIRTNSSRVGTMQMRYTGTDKDVFSIFLSALPFILLTLGIYSFWYRAKVASYRAQHTWIGSSELGAAHGRLDLSGGDLLVMKLINAIAIILTLGLALPWVIANNMSFYLRRLSFVGAIKFDSVQQVESSGSASADGIAAALDVGMGV